MSRIGCDGGTVAEYRLAVGCQCDSLPTGMNTGWEGHGDGRYKMVGLSESKMQSNAGWIGRCFCCCFVVVDGAMALGIACRCRGFVVVVV